MAGLTRNIIMLLVVPRIQPFVVSGLLHKSIAGVSTLGIYGFGDERMTGRAQSGVVDMLAEFRCNAKGNQHSRRKSQRIRAIRDPDIIGVKMYIARMQAT